MSTDCTFNNIIHFGTAYILFVVSLFATNEASMIMNNVDK